MLGLVFLSVASALLYFLTKRIESDELVLNVFLDSNHPDAEMLAEGFRTAFSECLARQRPFLFQIHTNFPKHIHWTLDLNAHRDIVIFRAGNRPLKLGMNGKFIIDFPIPMPIPQKHPLLFQVRPIHFSRVRIIWLPTLQDKIHLLWTQLCNRTKTKPRKKKLRKRHLKL